MTNLTFMIQCNLIVHKRTVHSPPNFLEKLSSVRVDWGENISLSVKAVGNPTPDLTWLKVKLTLYTYIPTILSTYYYQLAKCQLFNDDACLLTDIHATYF